MQVGVLSLLVAGLAFLVLGLTTGSTPLVLASTGASLLAVYVIVRVRREQQAGAAGASTAAAGQRATPENAPVGATAPAATTPSGSASAPGKPAHAEPVPATAEPVAIEPAQTEPAQTEPAQTEPARDEPAQSEPARDEPTEAIPTAPARDEPAGVTAPTEAITTAPGRDEPVGADAVDDLAIPDPAAADTDPPLRSRGDEPVWVIDGRPRYHLPHCGFLLGRQSEPVPLRQAFEDGFSPCALCDPDSGLTAG